MSKENIQEEKSVQLESCEPSRLSEMLQKTPWWVLSVAFHAVVLLILWRVNFGLVPEDRAQVEIVARLEKKKEPEYEPEKERDIERHETPLTDVEVEVDIPEVEVEVEEFDDHFETDEDMELSETAKGFDDAIGDFDAGQIGAISSIGVGGGGGGGKYGVRGGGGKRRAVARGGGGKDTENAVEAGLRWLMKHQAPDGAWHPDKWMNECPPGDSCVGKGGGIDIGKDRPAAITGFALLAYLGAGHTHQAGNYKQTVRKGLDYLKRIQNSEGRFVDGTAQNMYDHGIASLAAVEAYGMTRSSKYQSMAQKAIDYICKVQNPLGGWDYSSPSVRNDMSVSGWQIMALKSAKVGGLTVPDSTIKRVIRWLDIATVEDTGDVAYAIEGNNPDKKFPGGGGSITMRSAGALCHLFFGKDRKNPTLLKSGDVFLGNTPAWGPGNNLYYWYYATLVNFQMGDRYWKGWNKPMKNALLPSQIRGGHADGSWPAIGTYCDNWSRPGQTALSVLCLEVYYRYLPLYIR